MIRTRPMLVAVVLSALLWTGLSAATQSPEARALQEAIDLIESKADYVAALAKLEVASKSANRTISARALWYEAQIYERRDPPRAIAAYQRLVTEFGEQRDVASEARARLAALQPAPRGPSERLITNDRTLGGIGVPRWSPDGRFFIGLRLGGGEFSGSSLILTNAEDTTRRVIFDRAPGISVGFWVFSPDSRRFAALMPEAVERQAAGVIRGQVDAALVSAKGVLVVGNVATDATPTVVDIPEMGAINPFQPFTNPLAWSPDGRLLAVAMPVAPVRTFDLQVMDVATGRLRSIGLRAAGVFDLAWSPDGRDLLAHVARADGTSELRVAQVSTGESRALPLPGTPGARLRVVRWVGGREIQIRHLDSAQPKVEDTFLVNADSGLNRKTCSGQAFNLDVIILPSAKGDICREVTLDGKRQIVWHHASKQIMIRDLVTGVDRPLTSSPGEEYFGKLSPDDQVEIFVSNREGRWALYAAGIDEAPVARPVQLSVFNDLPSDLRPIWTEDGFVALMVRRESNILRVDIDPTTGKAVSEPRRLTQDGTLNYTPMVSPDGQRIAYWSRQGSRFGLAVMDSNGANERLIAEITEDFPGLRPSWRSPFEVLMTASPAGSSATFYLTAPAVTPRTLMTVNTPTGATTTIGELTELPTILGQPQYLPASGDLVHLGPDYRTLRARSLVNGSTRVVATFEGDMEVDSFLVSPDGRRVAYSLAQRYSNGRDCFSRTGPPVARAEDIRSSSCELGVLDLSTGERTVLASTRNPQVIAAWSPDGRFLLYGAANGPRVMDITSPDHANWPLLEPGAQLNWENRAVSWSPDGTFIVLTHSSQLWEWRQWSGVR